MKTKRLTLTDILGFKPLEIDGLRVDCNSVVNFVKHGDNIEIESEVIEKLSIMTDFGHILELNPNGAQFRAFHDKFVQEFEMVALEMAESVGEYKWTVTEELAG